MPNMLIKTHNKQACLFSS